jgi:flavorubredoxin
MEHRPPVPIPRLPPTRIATDTFLVHAHRADETGIVLPANLLVLRSARPAVIDTGMAEHREQVLDDVFALVEPADLAWIIVSHDDTDHTGNLHALVEAAPRATVVVDWLMRQRMGGALDVPARRQRWLSPGERLDIGDRALCSIRPPVYDSPTTRGFFDPTTGVYWSADGFGCPMREVAQDVGELDRDEWVQGMATFDRCTAPWITTTDERSFQASVDAIEGLGASVIVGSHTPPIGRHHVDVALSATRRSPSASVGPPPDQQTLDRLCAPVASEPPTGAPTACC